MGSGEECDFAVHHLAFNVISQLGTNTTVEACVLACVHACI